MKYVGSKNRIAKYIVPFIQKCIDDNNIKNFYDLFVGGANIIDKIKCENKFGNDINEYQIALLQALKDGWEPPKDLSEEQFLDIKKNIDKYPKELVGFAGFQMSYGSKWFQTYRKDKTSSRNYALEAYNNVKKQQPNLKDIVFSNKSYDAFSDIKDSVIYCDIPYKGTFDYFVKFDHDKFYDWCREMKKKNNFIFVSEYQMPEDFKCLWEKERINNIATRGLKTKDNIVIERLFTL